ncbi:hypothetical protein BKA70DRAFT_1428521 [Coprinopsis sp. MPI-PUGE-AT-0042]|nr:hypothetical protein BKA70DRAFT_1428521 [Coprinopsis sp. MPI-PUGE-AT-0042]
MLAPRKAPSYTLQSLDTGTSWSAQDDSASQRSQLQHACSRQGYSPISTSLLLLLLDLGIDPVVGAADVVALQRDKDEHTKEELKSKGKEIVPPPIISSSPSPSNSSFLSLRIIDIHIFIVTIAVIALVVRHWRYAYYGAMTTTTCMRRWWLVGCCNGC